MKKKDSKKSRDAEAVKLRGAAAEKRHAASSTGLRIVGMGTDGSQGIRAIKEQSGLVFVQDPKQAKFDDTPRSAISTGLADYVALVEALPEKLIQYLAHHPPVTYQEPFPEEEPAPSELQTKIDLLSRSNNDMKNLLNGIDN